MRCVSRLGFIAKALRHQCPQPLVPWVLVQAGYRNRFGHPAAVVTARYDERGIDWVASPQCGAATLRSAQPDRLDCHRLSRPRYWQLQPPRP